MQNKVELGREYETLWGDKVKVIKQFKNELRWNDKFYQ